MLLTHVPDDNTLILSITFHVSVAVVTNGKYVWWKLSNFTILVKFYLLSCVNWKNLVWIDRHQDGSSVCLEQEQDRS